MKYLRNDVYDVCASVPEDRGNISALSFDASILLRRVTVMMERYIRQTF